MRITEDYFRKQSDILHSRYKSSSIPDHNPSTGDNREKEIRDWLSKHLPKRVTPYLGGKIIDANDNISKQVDIIVYSNTYPRFGANPKSYYFSEGVTSAIEVKSVFDSNVLSDAIDNIDSIKRCELKYASGLSFGEPPKSIFAGIFAYETSYSSPNNIIEALNKKLTDSKKFVPDFVCVNRKGYIVFNYGAWQKFDKRRKVPKVSLPEGYVIIENDKLSILRMVMDISARTVRPVALPVDFQRYFLDKADWN